MIMGYILGRFGGVLSVNRDNKPANCPQKNAIQGLLLEFRAPSSKLMVSTTDFDVGDSDAILMGTGGPSTGSTACV